MSDFENILIDTTNKIMKDRCTKELVNEAEQGVYPKELWNELEEMGMTRVAVPEEAGGTGFSYKDALNILRIAGEFSAPIPLAETYVGNWFLNENGMELPDGSITVVPTKHVNNVKFEKSGDGYTATGVVTHIPFARNVDSIVVIGKDESDQAILAVVDRRDVSITEGISLAGEARDEVSFVNVAVSGDKAKVVSEKAIDRLRDLFALSRVVLMAGSLERTLELSIQYAQEREQFGRPIGKFQAVKQQLAVLAAQVASASIAADYAVDSLDKEKDLTHDVAMAKVRIGEAAETATAIAHQVHAAIGFTHEHPLHHNTRRLWTWRDEGGSESYWANLVGKYILSEFKEPVWNFITSTQEEVAVSK